MSWISVTVQGYSTVQYSTVQYSIVQEIIWRWISVTVQARILSSSYPHSVIRHSAADTQLIAMRVSRTRAELGTVSTGTSNRGSALAVVVPTCPLSAALGIFANQTACRFYDLCRQAFIFTTVFRCP